MKFSHQEVPKFLEIKKTYQKKVQPSHCPGCAHVPLLLATVEDSPVLDGCCRLHLLHGSNEQIKEDITSSKGKENHVGGWPWN